MAPPLFARSVAAASIDVLVEVLATIQQHAGSGPGSAVAQPTSPRSVAGTPSIAAAAAAAAATQRSASAGKDFSIESRKIAQHLLPVVGNPQVQETVANARHLLESADLPNARRLLIGLGGAIQQMTQGRRDLRFGDQELAGAISSRGRSQGGRGTVQIPFGARGRMELRLPLPVWVAAPHRSALNDLPCVLWLSGARSP